MSFVFQKKKNKRTATIAGYCLEQGHDDIGSNKSQRLIQKFEHFKRREPHKNMPQISILFSAQIKPPLKKNKCCFAKITTNALCVPAPANVDTFHILGK